MLTLETAIIIHIACWGYVIKSLAMISWQWTEDVLKIRMQITFLPIIYHVINNMKMPEKKLLVSE